MGTNTTSANPTQGFSLTNAFGAKTQTNTASAFTPALSLSATSLGTGSGLNASLPTANSPFGALVTANSAFGTQGAANSALGTQGTANFNFGTPATTNLPKITVVNTNTVQGLNLFNSNASTLSAKPPAANFSFGTPNAGASTPGAFGSTTPF